MASTIAERPSNDIFDNERELLNLLSKEKISAELDFSARLDHLSERLLAVADMGSTERESQIAVSERLHAGVLPHLITHLCSALKGKKQVIVLVDNLDKAWDRSENSKFLSYFFLGLLSALRRISEEFKNRPVADTSVKLAVCVFVRADIFQMVLEQAKEPDKIHSFMLRWDDPNQLRHLADCRIKVAAGVQDSDIPAIAVWNKFFQVQAFGGDLFSYILDIILPRPRDLLFFLRASILLAVNRRHDKVLEGDLLKAEEDYSNFAYQSMLVELRERLPDIESILDEFIGLDAVNEMSDVMSVIAKKISPPMEPEYVAKHLALCSFFEIEIPGRNYCMVNDEQGYARIMKAASNIAERQNKKVNFRIHRAFCSALLIGMNEGL